MRISDLLRFSSSVERLEMMVTDMENSPCAPHCWTRTTCCILCRGLWLCRSGHRLRMVLVRMSEEAGGDYSAGNQILASSTRRSTIKCLQELWQHNGRPDQDILVELQRVAPELVVDQDMDVLGLESMVRSRHIWSILAVTVFTNVATRRDRALAKSPLLIPLKPKPICNMMCYSLNYPHLGIHTSV